MYDLIDNVRRQAEFTEEDCIPFPYRENILRAVSLASELATELILAGYSCEDATEKNSVAIMTEDLLAGIRQRLGKR